MMREFDKAIRERRESEARLADVRMFAARLQTQEERLTIIAELQAAWEAAEKAKTAPPTPAPPAPPAPPEEAPVAPPAAAAPRPAAPPAPVWSPPTPPANDAKLKEGFLVDDASVARLENLVRASEGGVSVAMAAAELGIRRPLARHTLRRIHSIRGTIDYSPARCRWYASNKLDTRALTLGQIITHILSDGDAFDAHQIAARATEFRPNANAGSVAAQLSRMEDEGTVEVLGLSPHSRGRLYRLKTKERCG